MVTAFENFLNTPDPNEKSASYEDYTKKVWGTATEIASAPELTEKDLGLDGMNPAQKFMELARKYENLSGRMESAEIANDPSGNGLKRLAADFQPKENKVQKVKLPEALVDKYGGDASKLSFGAKTINSPEELEKLQAQVNTAKKYLENIELHVIKDKDGKDVAIVMGADAKEFNAVIAAERQKEQLGQMRDQAKAEMMGVKKAPEAAQGQEQTASLNMDRVKELAASLPSVKRDDQGIAAPLPGGGKDRSNGIGGVSA